MKRKVIRVTTIVTALLECGHVIGIEDTEKAIAAKEHPCYKCEAGPTWQCPECRIWHRESEERCCRCKRMKP